MKILIVGDEQKNRRMVSWGFASSAFEVRSAHSRAGVEKLVAAEAFHAACIDLKMKDDDGGAIVETLQRKLPRLPLIALVSAEERISPAALKARGICAHVKAPFPIAALHATIANHAAKEPVGALRPASAPATSSIEAPRPLVANDEVAKRALETALRAASSNVAILILGETGTGKSLLAQTIHQHSAIKHKPFVTVSCPCLNRELLESDLFGHVRGAFTGAVQDTWGKVAAADGGTLFLDEIGDLPAALQPKLLRLLQEKQYERVGETTPRTANVRIIAATNRDLKSEVAAGRFREDLYYRLNVISVEVPPLRNRPGDIMPAAESFLAEICRQLGRRAPAFSLEARRLIESHAWPGNLRELRNAIERASILASGAVFDAQDFSSLLAATPSVRHQIGAPISLQAVEEAHIQMIVAKSGSLEEAARILQIDKSTLYRKRKAMEERVAAFTPPVEAAVAMGS